MPIYMWIGWALLCIAQNFAFTFVSRARNSGSLKKHMVAGFFSNGVWFVGQLFAVSAFMGILSGKFGVIPAIFAGLFYTIFTLTGSLAAHQYALKTEKGTSRVGAHKDVATFTQEEGKMIRERVLFIDNGDGIGTFTLEEIAKLKSLCVEKTDTPYTLDEDDLITESTPDGIYPASVPYDQAVSEVIREGYPITGNDCVACSTLGTKDLSGLSIPSIPGQGAKL